MAHRGRVDVSSAAGGGSTFTITLPFSTAAPTEPLTGVMAV
jgi:signal transduction histidine kinase